MICNADESEPGTFKNRELLLRAPHLVIEGMILAGLLIHATRGFVYLRLEYQEQIEAVQRAIREAERLRVCGERILETDWSFPIEIFVSPGGYICGEQTALLEAMEDRRAEPRNRPPEVSTNGLFDKPTLISNVETFAWVPYISLRGGESYRDQTQSLHKGALHKGALRKGRRFFSISGDVNLPGVYEVPVGISLGSLIDQYAGGMLDDRPLKACASSGPSGGFLPARLPIESCLVDRLRKHIVRTRDAAQAVRQRMDDGTPTSLAKSLKVDAEMLEIDAESLERFVDKCLPRGTEHLDIRRMPLDLTIVRNHMKLMLGAGIVIYAKGTDMVSQAVNATEFFRNESCGKCVPCRLGSEQLVQIGQAIQNQDCDVAWIDSTRGEREALVQTMCDTSICGLGYVASVPISTLLEYFRPELVERNSFRSSELAENPFAGQTE